MSAAMNLISDHSYRHTTLAQVASQLASSQPTEVAIVFDSGATLSYGDAWNQSRLLASAMQKAGLKPGDTLSFQLPNIVESG